MLCFDPTRGIDIRTKQQIYVLLRDLAAAGAAVLLYTSELKEIQLACDRAIVIFGGRVVAEIAAADADEPTLLRAAYNLKSDAPMPEDVAADVIAEPAKPRRPRRLRGRDLARARRIEQGLGGRPMSAATGDRRQRAGPPARRARRLGAAQRLDARPPRVPVLLLVFTKLIQPTYGADRASRASRSPSCRSPSPPSRRRSSSSRAGSTSRSAR